MMKLEKYIKGKCERCGESDQDLLDNHHVHGRKHSNETIVLCVKCHRKHHRKEGMNNRHEAKPRHSVMELWLAGVREPTNPELWVDELWWSRNKRPLHLSRMTEEELDERVCERAQKSDRFLRILNNTNIEEVLNEKTSYLLQN